MKTKLFRSLAAALLVLAAPAAFAQITAGNVRAAQRAGTKLVDIDYDLTGVATPCYVRLEISADGGTTWTIPATTLAGAVGNNVTPGTNLRITWNAGVDWNGQASAQTRFRIKADDAPPDLVNFAAIPAGNFQMGDALDSMAAALPVHTVNVSAFYMRKKGVTKAEWDAGRAWGLTHGYTDLAAGAGKAADHPVQLVSWYDVVKWCNARSEQESLSPCYYTDAEQTVIFKTGSNNLTSTMVKWTANGYRLPTEAEWEKAVRGGLIGKRYPWGDIIGTTEANYLFDGNPWVTGAIPYTSPAGSFPANAYGIYDMAGNLWEWCWDVYDAGYYASSPAVDPTGPSGPYRVLRGGGWNDYADSCRAAIRTYGSAGEPLRTIGFRPVRR